MSPLAYDSVIGSGPAVRRRPSKSQGRRRVLVSKREHVEGVRPPRTIPSKALRETRSRCRAFADGARCFEVNVREDLQVSSLMLRLDAVIRAHERYIADQLRLTTSKFGVAKHALSRYRDRGSPVDGGRRKAQARDIVIAVGSAPGGVGIPIDHEHVLDSDSILSMRYCRLARGSRRRCHRQRICVDLRRTRCPRCHDRSGPRPLGFLDPELTERFVRQLESTAADSSAARRLRVSSGRCEPSGHRSRDGETVRTEKMLCALGEWQRATGRRSRGLKRRREAPRSRRKLPDRVPTLRRRRRDRTTFACLDFDGAGAASRAPALDSA